MKEGIQQGVLSDRESTVGKERERLSMREEACLEVHDPAKNIPTRERSIQNEESIGVRGIEPMLVSILVCTRNRMAKLKNTLDAILGLEPPTGLDFEVIVVDNGSTDSTAELCREFEGRFPRRFRRVYLGAPGLSRAANAGFDAARGQLIAYLDDDVIPGRDWLQVVCREFARDPSLGMISGRVELLNQEDLPICIRRHVGRREFASLGDAYSLFTGCNLAIRRSLIERVGLFDPDIGTGSRFGSAGDTDFFYRAWKATEKMIYVPELFILHDHGRRTQEAWKKVAKDYVVGRGAFYAKHILHGDFLALREMYWELVTDLREIWRRQSRLGWRGTTWLLKGFFGYCLMRAARTFRLAPRAAA